MITNISFTGGCNGNLKAIPLLVDGWTVEEIERKLSGVTCGRRPTSCEISLLRFAGRHMKNRKKGCRHEIRLLKT